MGFRIEKEESLNKTVRMPEPLIKELEDVARDQGVSFNQVVVQCCRYALKNLEGKAKKNA
jgi:predicted HicB family RNase H-like nuclease